MADRFRRMPVEAEVAPGDGQVGGHSQFFATARSQQGAVVADTQAETAPRTAHRSLANLAEQGQFATVGGCSKLGRFYRHFMRIGQAAWIFVDGT
jgi:hypothetical protein